MSKLAKNLFFREVFKENKNEVALIWKDNEVTYEQLLERINFWDDELSRLKSKSIVGLEGDFSPETISILFSLITRDFIVVPLDRNHSDKNQNKYQIAQLDVLIRVSGDDSVTFQQIPGSQPKNSFYDNLFVSNIPGLVLFTSGSSGKPKAALHNLEKLLSKFQIPRKAHRTINFLLFDHWGGLNTLFHILSNAGTVVILENRNPDYVCELIDKHKVELLPTSPTFLNMLLISRAYERHLLSSLKIISYGAEPMPASLLERLTNIFPHISFQQTYGLIELGVMRSKSEANGSLWVKIGGEGYQVRVVDGLLQIKSDSAMLGYLNANSPFTEDGWFMTGDAVEVNGDYFKILGRKSELINVGGEKVFPQEVESIIMEIDGIVDVIIYGENHPFTGKIVCAKVNYNGILPSNEIISRIKTYCRSKLEPFKVPIKIQIVNESFESHRFKKSRVKW